MARRWTGNMCGEKYLVDAVRRQVHDLDSEATGRGQCEIDAIIGAGNDRPYTAHGHARRDGNENCYWCLAASRR